MAAPKPAEQPEEKTGDVEAPEAVEVPALRYLVTYPKVSIIYPDGDGYVEVIVLKGEYLDQRVPAEVAATKGTELLTYGMAVVVSGAQQ